MSYFARYSQSFEPFENKWEVLNKTVGNFFFSKPPATAVGPLRHQLSELNVNLSMYIFQHYV